MRVWGVLRKIGELSTDAPIPTRKRKFSTPVGTLPDPTNAKGGTAICIKVHGDLDKVYKRFEAMRDEWKTLMQYKCAGNNNPVVSSSHIYTLYDKGIDYLRKETYDIQVMFKP